MRIAGHALMNEGAAFDDSGIRAYHLYATTGGIGRAKCECGEMSEVLTSVGARQYWHRLHKEDVLP
jgi:hypothetical protein